MFWFMNDNALWRIRTQAERSETNWMGQELRSSFWHMSALRLICINGRGNGPATVASDFWAI